MTKKEMFNIIFNKALDKGIGLLVEIEVPNMVENEIIINPPKNIKAKVEYYNRAYNDNMCLRTNNDIKMVDANVYYFLN